MQAVAPMPGPTAVDYRQKSYQELKSRVHSELLNRLNLDRLAQVRREDGEPEIRTLISGMLDGEYRQTPLSLTERETLMTEVLDELQRRREMLHVVVTGRNAKEALIEEADLVTEMKLLKHPYRSGIKAQKGVEY